MDQTQNKKFWYFKQQKAKSGELKSVEKTGHAEVSKLEVNKNAQSKPKAKKISAAPITKRNLMTEREQQMYEQLVRALPYSVILAQVSFNSLIETTVDDWSARNALRAQFNRMVVDFVIYDKNNHQVIAIVELDDSTHNNLKVVESDQKRDAMLKQAGYFVLRYTEIPELGEIIKKIKAIKELSG